MEFENRTGAPGLEGTYVEREEILGMFASNSTECSRTTDSSYCEQVAVLVRELGRGRESGLDVNQRTVAVYTLVDGKVSRIEAFPDPGGDLREVLDEA